MSEFTEERIVLGDIEVRRVVELDALPFETDAIVPDMPDSVWRENADRLAPDHWDPVTGNALAAIQSWVLRSEGLTVLVDTGVGNGRVRPGVPPFEHLDTPYLDRLAATGVRPEDVDVVVNTHLHADHVGWNTRAQDGDWVPTFPNASYLIPAADHAHFGPGRGGEVPPELRAAFADSVEPVVRAGQAVLWEGAHRIDARLTLEAAPGHTPGSAVLRLASGGDRAVFVGDLLHTPAQLFEPGCSSCFCENPKESAESRVRVLGRAADEGELLVPAHFRGAGVAQVARAGGKFSISRWGA
ncbi:MBL fold metallo-hydrolase [Streptomyces kanamyceticus]|uniref:MBL fold metallo-hydrolase n=1 Tax=Streptomyces kanamyceticus TaxID=1967 RepID=A0A5J6GR80_STRKN|nr:MBL fold metallo-hydrolase [Streptomyces kanamyceticus]QEU97533.1 MBL fold metallo-hydrolase [Streptomyces kanamyceticus]